MYGCVVELKRVSLFQYCVKKCVGRSDQNLDKESRQNQQREQLPIRGVGGTSAAVALGYAFVDTKAAFERLAHEVSPKLGQPPLAKR